MNKIVVDLLNNDNGEIEAIKAVNKFAKLNSDYTLYIVGNKKNIDTYIDKSLSNIIPSYNGQIVSKTSENIREVLSSKSSMLEAFDILDEMQADGILSSGDSGSFITMATLKIRRIKNISRPAFMPIIPSPKENHKYLLLDAGANLNIKDDYLFNWGVVATEFYKTLFNKSIVRIGILNIGSEEYKGLDILKSAQELCRKNFEQIKNIDYLGFVEPKNIVQGDADIVLADGYAGNLYLKTLESSFMSFGRLFKNILTSKFMNKIAGLIIRKDLRKLKNKFDYRNTGGAFVIGLEKLVVKAHGGSDELAFYNALNQIKLAIDNKVIDNLKKHFAKGEN